MTEFLSPAECGFAMPPEWSRQEGVFLSWPHNPATWPATMPEIRKIFAKFASAISRYEKVYLLRGNASAESILEELCAANATIRNVRILDIRTNDVWCRDHGPVFVRNASTGERAIVDFTYNAWGGKFPPWDADNAVPGRIAEKLKMKRFPIPVVCEGGALEINSLGDLMTTETVLLNPNRNPGIGKEEMEAILKAALGAKNILWLKQGLAGDDTDGHIDTLARFIRDDAILAAIDETPSGRNRKVLRENIRILERNCNLKGEKFEVIPLPCPDPIEPEGWRETVLPATYTNYLILNGAVLAPSYRNDKYDAKACEILSRCFPRHKVEMIDCFDIILEGGALHCLSQQMPA